MNELNNEEEIWKPVIGYEGWYEISNLGRLHKLPFYDTKGSYRQGGFTSQQLSHKGYITVRLCKEKICKTTGIHRIIAEAFIPNPDNKPQINHKNGIKTDNRIENLEWCTNQENQNHAVKHGLKVGCPGEINPKAIFTNNDVDNIKALYNSGKTAKEIAKQFNAPLGRIRSILYNFSWKTNTTKIEKRDDRGNWTEDHLINSLISKLNSKGKKAIKPVGQYDLEGNEIAIYRSIKQAEDKTGIARSSISYSINNSTSTKILKAGGYIWKKLQLTNEQYKTII